MWERCKELFNRRYESSIKLLQKFFALPKLERASGFGLQKLCNTTHEVVRQLRTMQYPVEHYSLFIVFGLHERFDAETSKAWELERLSDNPTTAEILAFLDRQAKAAKTTPLYGSVVGIGATPVRIKRKINVRIQPWFSEENEK